MDFAKLKSEALKLTDKAKQASKNAAEFWASKLADSSMTLKSVKDIENVVEKSATTSWKDSKTWEEKKFTHRSVILFIDTSSEFFKQMLYAFPILSAKAFSQNITLKMADIHLKDLDMKKYQISGSETLVVFENKKVLKVITQKEKIQKIVKEMSLDINKSIENA